MLLFCFNISSEASINNYIIVIISFIHVSPLNLDPSLSQVYVNILGEYGVKMYRLEEICHQASSVLNNCP